MNRLAMAAILMLSAFAAAVQAQQKVFNDNQNKTNMESNTIRLTIEGGRTFTATLVDNSSTQALKEQLAKGNITVEMAPEKRQAHHDRPGRPYPLPGA